MPEPVPSPEETAIIEAPQEFVDAIIADLVERTGAVRTAVEVLPGEVVVWNGGALGCPQPGVMYTQVMVNGYWVVLGYDDKEFDYRAGNRESFFLCERRLLLRVGTPGGGAGEAPDQ